MIFKMEKKFDKKALLNKIKKSEVAVYAIALMLVTAGYFNYLKFDNGKAKEVYSEDVQNLEQQANVGDAVLVSNNEVKDENANTEEEAKVEENKIEKESKTEENKQEEEQKTEENKEGQKQNKDNSKDDYFASTKLDREKMYASMISSYEEILNNSNVTEAQKAIATQEIAKVNNTKNAIMISENLILTKGFKNVVILVNEDSANVVVEVQEELSKDKVAILQNIVARELSKTIENIHISEKRN
jgi:stage III sporulation protein AH